MPAQPGAERLRVQGAGLPSDDISLSEQHQGRNASDVVADGQFWLAFSVHLETSDVGLEFGADTLVDRRHRFAWPAPLRPSADPDLGQLAPRSNPRLFKVTMQRWSGLLSPFRTSSMIFLAITSLTTFG